MWEKGCCSGVERKEKEERKSGKKKKMRVGGRSLMIKGGVK